MSERNAVSAYSKREFAEIFGVSEAQLERHFQAGMPHTKTSSRKIEIPMPAGRVWYHDFLVEKGKKMAAPKDGDSSKLRKLTAEAELAELELAEKRRELMTVAQGETWLSDAFARARARLTNLAPRIAGAVVGCITVQEAQARVEPLVREVMDELRKAEDVPEPEEAPQA